MRKLKTIWMAFCFVWLLAAQAFAADVLIVSEVLEGFSRITFRSDFPLDYQIQKQGTQVTLDFQVPVYGDFASIAARLTDSVASVTPSAGNKKITIRTKRSFVVRDFKSGNDISIDLLGANDPPLPPQPVATVTQLSSSTMPRRQAVTRLFVVQRGDDNRLVFSFPSATSFTENKTDSRYEITFNSRINPSAFNFAPVLAALPADLRSSSLVSEGGKLKLSMPTANKYHFQAEQDGRRINVAVSTKPFPVINKQTDAPQFAAAGKQSADVSKSEPPKIGPSDIIIDDDDVTIPYNGGQQNISLSLLSPQSFNDTQILKSEVEPTPEAGYRSVTLSFPWKRMTAVASFRRDGYLWIIFDRKAEFDFSLELEIYKDIIYEMVQIPHSQATIFRLITAKGYNPSLRREGLLWIVDLMYQPIRARRAVDLVLQRKTAFGPRIFIPLDEAPQIVPLIDPEVGDLMYIVPLFALGKGMPHQRSFVDATFLPTAQGIVIEPNVEDLTVYVSTSGVEVRGPKGGGMRFSSEDILSFLAKSQTTKNPLEQLLDVGLWGADDPVNYVKELKEREAAVINASTDDKPIKRLELARYYLASGMYPEALGVLRVIAADTPKFTEEPSFIALRGAANFMMMRYDEAIEDFSSPILGKEAAVDYWRAATLAATSRTPELYLKPMKDNMMVLQVYPQPVKTRLALAGVHSAVAAVDEFAVQNFIEAAFSSQNSSAESAEIVFYHALSQESLGMYGTARREIASLFEGKDLYYHAMGGLERVRLETKYGSMKPEERIAELEKLSYGWRGDAFEYNLMTMLVDAYQDQKDYVQVLHILKNMQLRFADMPESKQIPQIMENIFTQLFLDEDEENLPPIKAIALYDEFKDLAPEGERGVLIVRRLADRLVAIDLLDRAAELLDEQLKRPIGVKERALIATRLALVRLLNKEPQKALDALGISENNRFSEKMQQQRLHMKAKALADLGKPEEAAVLLDKDESKEAKMLKAEIYWQAQIWDKAADALKVLISKPQPDVPLTPEEAQRVLDWAAALRLAGRPKVVLRLRENFLPYMQQTDLAAAFDFITTSPQQGVLDYRTVAKEIESAESFQSFAKGYTDLLKTKGLSEAVQ